MLGPNMRSTHTKGPQITRKNTHPTTSAQLSRLGGHCAPDEAARGGNVHLTSRKNLFDFHKKPIVSL